MRSHLVVAVSSVLLVGLLDAERQPAAARAAMLYALQHRSPIVECRMPVAVPDLRASEPMPTDRRDPAPFAIQIVPGGCVNPLGPAWAPWTGSLGGAPPPSPLTLPPNHGLQLTARRWRDGSWRLYTSTGAGPVAAALQLKPIR